MKRLCILFYLISGYCYLLRAENPVTLRINSVSGDVNEFPIKDIESVEFTDHEATPIKTPLYGKKIGYNGDSLFAGFLFGQNDNGGGPAHIISLLTGSSYDNRAKGGATMARCSKSLHNIVDDIDNMPEDLDLICLEGGVNDFWNNVPPGEITPANDFTQITDESTYFGALESVFRKALNRWPGKPIVFIIPHKISGAYGFSHGENLYSTFTDGAKTICKKYGVPYIDGEAIFNLNGYLTLHRQLFFRDHDGVHPNEEGYKRYWVKPMITLFSSLLY